MLVEIDMVLYGGPGRTIGVASGGPEDWTSSRRSDQDSRSGPSFLHYAGVTGQLGTELGSVEQHPPAQNLHQIHLSSP